MAQTSFCDVCELCGLITVKQASVPSQTSKLPHVCATRRSRRSGNVASIRGGVQDFLGETPSSNVAVSQVAPTSRAPRRTLLADGRMTANNQRVVTSRTKKTKRRDHYLPQGYLRGFIDPTRKKCHRPLWHFDIPQNTWSERSTVEVGWRKGFYDYAGAEIGLGTADNTFSELERNYPLVRAELISNNFAKWTNHREFLLRYMQMMRARSLLFLDQKEAEGKTLQALVVEQVSPDRRSIKVRSLTPSPLPPTFIRNRAITQMREEIAKGAAWLNEFNWALRYCDSPTDPFVATEIPFVLQGTCASLEEAIRHQDTLLFFPLCWQACLIGSRQIFHIETDRFAPEDMRKVRRRYRENAKLFLVSPQKLDDL